MGVIVAFTSGRHYPNPLGEWHSAFFIFLAIAVLPFLEIERRAICKAVDTNPVEEDIDTEIWQK
jgi:hypothetical protein